MRSLNVCSNIDLEGKKEVAWRLFSGTLDSDRVTGVNSSYSSSSFQYYCDPKPQFQRQIELPIQQCPCQPTRSRQTSNLVLERLPKGMVQP
ncbi:hypothetical protein TNCV_1292371 [Trichonephila clavipes]|nr:hypothetical protein TNCV_1292371 [Trichonephila clavipes]